MEIVERTQYQATLAITGAWQGQNSTRNSDGNPYLTGVGAGAFFRFKRLKTTRLLPISETNYLLTADFCIDVKILILFMK